MVNAHDALLNDINSGGVGNSANGSTAAPPPIPSSASPGASSGAKGGMDFGPIIRTLQRNILVIVGVAGVAAVPAFLSAARSPRVFQGSFSILVEPITSQGRSTDPSAISRQTVDMNGIDYPTLLQVLQSPDLLGEIAAKIQSRYPEVNADWLRGEIFTKNLSIQRVGAGTDYMNASKVIEVVYKGRDPQLVQLVLEELSKGYLSYSLADRQTRIGGGVDFIEDQLPRLQETVNKLETQLQRLRQQYRLTDPSTQGTGLTEQLKSTQTLRLTTQRELAEQLALYNRLQGQLGLTPDEAMVAASLSENARYQELVSQIKKLESQIAVQSARLTPNAPPARALQEQRDRLVQLLQAETQENLGQRLSAASSNPQILNFQNPLRMELIRQLVTTSNTTQLLQIRNQAIQQTEAALDRQLQQFPSILREYNDIQQRLEIATKTLNQFLTQRETLKIEAAQKEVPWEVIAPPKLIQDSKGNPVPAPSDASKKMIPQIAIGVFLGVAAAFLKERISNVFRSSADIQSATKLPMLAVIPYQSELAAIPATSSTRESSKVFDALYTNLRFLTDTPVRSMVIASAGVGDGKTTIALHLARSAASIGQRVLLVDANLRTPLLHLLLNLQNSSGVSDLLLQENLEWQKVVQEVSAEKNLFVLTAGQANPDAPRMLASSRMQTLMRQIQSAYDLIIYDTPNMAEFPDASFLIGQTSGALMVGSLYKVKVPALKKAMSEIKKFRLPTLGVIANHVTTGKRPQPAPQPSYAPLLEGGAQPSMLESLKIFKPTSSSTSIK